MAVFLVLLGAGGGIVAFDAAAVQSACEEIVPFYCLSGRSGGGLQAAIGWVQQQKKPDCEVRLLFVSIG